MAAPSQDPGYLASDRAGTVGLMPARNRYGSVRDRIIRRCDADTDSRALRLDLLKEIGAGISFDAFAWLLTDPETSVGSAPLADVPCLPELPRLIRLKYLTTVNRWTAIGETGISSLRIATGDDRGGSRLWRELLSEYDIGDVASLTFRDGFGCWAFLDLWRTGDGATFLAEEVEFLAQVIGPVTTALRKAQARELYPPDVDARARTGGPVVLLLSPELDVIGQTAESAEYLELLVPSAQDRSPIPAAAYNVAAQLLAREDDVDRNLPFARTHLADGLWVTMKASRIGPTADGADSNIAVTIETTSPTDRLGLFARAHGLSRRETEILGYLAAGLDTRHVAQRTFLAEYTVQDHLKAIFAKTATNNRPMLLSRALGT
ncbi:MAG: LuxR family transcriptional regulator [Acidimicrobiia bacterium]|nr:LuxR family transcriptional regulator [Acidimicrobiia bacterium]